MLHTKAVEPPLLELLRSFMARDYLQQFVLVGGTALALQLGHRKSIDLYLFTLADFSSDDVIRHLQDDYKIHVLEKHPQTIICQVQGIKVDFIRFHYPFLKPVIEDEGIRMLSVEDIAPMKLDAITGRGSKKDFYDLYFLLKNYALTELLSLYQKKYPHETIFHIIRSLTYFVDAESDPDPMLLKNDITWPEVKRKIISVVQKI
ncbi:MAG: nucleotidyl transferase AbiEii/AbiGii toxin family protein [Bacteroidia bacterium]